MNCIIFNKAIRTTYVADHCVSIYKQEYSNQLSTCQYSAKLVKAFRSSAKQLDQRLVDYQYLHQNRLLR